MAISTLAKIGATSTAMESVGAGMNISKAENNPETITSSVVGLAGNVAIDIGLASSTFVAAAGTASTGIGIAIAIFQVTFALIDVFANPFQTYFNKDLAELKKTIDEQLNTVFLSNGYGFPLEVKPDIIPQAQEDIDKFRSYIIKYNEDNGLITQEDVLLEENLVKELRKIKRFNRVTANPYFDNLNILSGTSQNQALLIAAAAAKKKGYQKPEKPALLMDYSKYQPKPSQIPPEYNVLTNDWQILMVILIILFLCLISVSIIIVL